MTTYIDVTEGLVLSDEFLAHIGTKRHSGRYPWGSGDTPNQRNKSFLNYVDDMRRQGMSDNEIARGMGLNSREFREKNSVAKNEIKAENAATALKLKESGMSNVAIGTEMGIGESSVRALLSPASQQREDVINTTATMLKEELKTKDYLDVGAGTENHLGISQTKLSTALSVLKDEGYRVDKIDVQQLGTGKFTKVKVLSPPGTEYKDLVQNQDKIRTVSNYSEDGGRTFLGILPPVGVKSSRVDVRYAEDGGATKDGVIELRRGVPDLSLGNARYAQVRIQVDDTHYLKGMAMYSDDLPKGVDMVFNTNKSDTGNKKDAMKPLKTDKKTGNVDEDNPFGSIVRQKHYVDASGKKKLSPLNIVGTEDPDGNKTPGEEGAWYGWSKTLSSQMLSKQSPALAKQQLDIAYDTKRAEYDEINALTNPTVKKALLRSFSDSADASSVNLKAAGLPRTRNHVILPINSLKDTEIYAPQYNNGEKVVLIRHPHGGIFEIPELTVNNRNPDAKRLLQNAKDAVGINSKVAERLSGADFDGDTVLVIPNAQSGPNRVRNKKPLKDLEDFDPKVSYPPVEGMKVMRSKQTEMGKISNLITDMTILGAPDSDIARAVRHSMVVIDAEKHNLNYKLSETDNGIAQLKTKYQGGPTAGAKTLISRISSDVYVPNRKPRPASQGGPIDPATGKKVYVETGETYVKRTTSARTGKVTEKVKRSEFVSKKGAETDDAFSLVSQKGVFPIETVYATHSNKMKALANEARKTMISTPPLKYSPSANKAYKTEVESLNAKLNIALKNAPLERQAQILGNATLNAKKAANPNMDADEIKKIKSQALAAARVRTGARKESVFITDNEWAAIQAGAITNNKLDSILKNSDLDRVKELATPRDRPVMSDAMVARAQNMLARGFTQAEVAGQLGVPTSTLNDSLDR